MTLGLWLFSAAMLLFWIMMVLIIVSESMDDDEKFRQIEEDYGYDRRG